MQTTDSCMNDSEESVLFSEIKQIYPNKHQTTIPKLIDSNESVLF